MFIPSLLKKMVIHPMKTFVLDIFFFNSREFLVEFNVTQLSDLFSFFSDPWYHCHCTKSPFYISPSTPVSLRNYKSAYFCFLPRYLFKFSCAWFNGWESSQIFCRRADLGIRKLHEVQFRIPQKSSSNINTRFVWK